MLMDIVKSVVLEALTIQNTVVRDMTPSTVV
jgi:hypothetical protein